MITYESSGEADTKEIAETVGEHVKEGTALLLIGNLGAGKTLFTKSLAKTLGAKEEVTSPTFNIMNIYEGICPIYHFDLYRLNAEEELEDVGFYEYVESGEGISVIEWADKFDLESFENVVKIKFEIISENKRQITIDGEGELAKELLEALQNIEEGDNL